MDERRRLPESELEIMLAVWNGEGEVSAPQIMEAMERPLTASALHSYLKRLEEKGFLSCRKEGRTNWYAPLVSRVSYQEQEGKNVLDKLYAGSLKRFAAALYDGGALNRADVDELRAYLDELEKGGS
jgi:predicted transcriptional regulator